jgi:hypothetical protein
MFGGECDPCLLSFAFARLVDRFILAIVSYLDGMLVLA